MVQLIILNNNKQKLQCRVFSSPAASVDVRFSMTLIIINDLLKIIELINTGWFVLYTKKSLDLHEHRLL